MKPADLNMLAMMADAEQRATAQLIEMIAAAVIVKLAPPEGAAVVEVEIGQGDINDALVEHFYEATYDEQGAMTMRVTRILPDPA